MRKSFTWFLSLMVLLTAFATSGYAQEQQETVELYAEMASDCYNEADDYTVTISVRDFIKLTEFDLDLEFNDEVYAYKSVSGLHSSLGTATVGESAGVINIAWDGSATTIGDNVKTQILVLHFSLLGYPGNTATTFVSDMDWTTTDFWYTLPDNSKDPVNTVTSADGSLTVDVEMTGIETSLTSETCFGGEATVTVTAPAAAMYLFNEDPSPANWVWTSSPNYLAAAGETVTIRVKDANGCMSLVKSIVIPETIEPVDFTVTTQDPNCYGAKGSVVINATGGTAPYKYYISVNADGSDADMKSNFQFSIVPGTYYVSVQDANDCAVMVWEEITIVDNNPILEVGATVTDVMCYGEATGEILAEVVQGDLTMVSLDGVVWKVLPYTFEDLPAGTYDVHAKNDNGCMVTLEDVVIAQPAAPITFDIEIDDATCGGDDDGSITVMNVSGGTGMYDYSLDGINYVPSAVFSGLSPTYYSLWVRDANGCVVEYDNPNGTGNTIAVQSPDDIMFDVVVTDPPCNDEDAVVTISKVTGGTSSYDYSFDGGSTWGTVMAYNWAAPYNAMSVVVRNKTGDACEVSQDLDSDDVDNPEMLMVNVFNELAPTCIDGNDGNITLEIVGGTSPYYYSINGSSWKMTDDEFTNIKANVGTHNIMVKDANDCEYDTEIEVIITLEENLITATSDMHIDCFGTKTGTIRVEFTDWAEGVGTRAYDYYVENADGQVTSFVPSNQGGTATLFNAGTYTIWVIDQYTCESNKDTAVVTQNDELLIASIVSNAASCFETFEGNITIYATGGNTDELEYAVVNNEAALGNIDDSKWLPFDTYDNTVSPALSTVSFEVDGGTYWIAVRDDNCDELTQGPIVVEGYKELLVDEDDIIAMDPLCYETETGSITVPMSAVSGGAGSYKFTLLQYMGNTETAEAELVLKSNTIDDPNWVEVEDMVGQATGEFTGLGEGLYKVLVEDAMDCPSYTTEEIFLEDPDELTFDTDITHMRCENTNDGVITINVTGGTPNYWYAINNMNAWVAFGAGNTSKTYIATEPGTFEIWVKDANGCVTESQSVTILEPTALSATVTVNNNVSCNGGSDGQIMVVGTGGWSGMTEYEFKINTGAWTSSTTLGGLPAGTHTLYIRDVHSYGGDYQDLDCTYSLQFIITQPGKITYDVVIENVKCKDGDDGTFTVNVISGGTPYDLAGTTADGYDVKLTGDAYDSGWIRTGADKSHTFTDLAHSHYTVYITDSKGCVLNATVGNSTAPYTTIESWEVAEPDTYLELEAMWLKDATCYNSEDGEIKLTANGGTAPYKYYAGLSIEPDGHVLVPEPPAANSDEWMDNDTLMVGAGTWVVWVLDNNGCILGGEYDEFMVPVNEWRVKVEQPAQVVWDFHKTGSPLTVHYMKPKCFGSWDGEIHLVSIAGGSGTYNARVWGTSADGMAVDSTYKNITLDGSLYKLKGVPASNATGFSVTVTDSKGCTSATRTIVVGQPTAVSVSLEQSPDNYSCFGAVEGWIEATATGGTGAYSYQLLKDGVVLTPWQSIASAFLVKVGHTYTVEVKDANGCQTSDELWMPTPLKVAYSYEDLTCNGDEKASVTITATGTPGREFTVWYKQIEDQPANAPFIQYNGIFAESIQINDVFEFDNENFVDLHYAVYVEDDHGCASPIDTLTFDQVQTALTVAAEVNEVTECSETYTITSIVGGVAPYVVMLDDSVMTEMSYTLLRGMHTVKVMDAHMCYVEEMIEVVGMYVTRDTTINTYIDEETAFVDAEAGIDTMLAVGTYTWDYMLDCERTLNVIVVEIPRPYTIAEVQGDGDASPIVGKIAKITGTVTGIALGEGFFVQDANAANSGIWVEYSGVNDIGIAVGDGVSVVGEVAEMAAVTSIIASEVVDAEGTVAITAMELAPTDAEAEMYESVLVKVPGARASAADAGTGEWSIYYVTTDNIIVNNWLYSSTPVEGDFYDVTGIVNGRLDAFKLEPRMESDVVDVTTTKVNPGVANTFKLYPNPFNEQITIDNYDKLTRVVVSNIAGQRVIDIEYPTREIRTANLVSGIYVISLFTEDGIAKTERMIKR